MNSSSSGPRSTSTTSSSTSGSNHNNNPEDPDTIARRLQTDADAEMARRLAGLEPSGSHRHHHGSVPLPMEPFRNLHQLMFYPTDAMDQVQTGQLEFHHLQAPSRHRMQFFMSGGDEGEMPIFSDGSVDLDNMSYEEILELEERLGKVKRGAPIEVISSLPTSRFQKSKIKSSLPSTPSTTTTPSKTGDRVEREGKEKEAKSPGISAEEKTCCFCLEDFQDGEEIRRLPCFHIFHQEEIDKWLLENNNCPICKTPIT